MVIVLTMPSFGLVVIGRKLLGYSSCSINNGSSSTLSSLRLLLLVVVAARLGSSSCSTFLVVILLRLLRVAATTRTSTCGILRFSNWGGGAAASLPLFLGTFLFLLP